MPVILKESENVCQMPIRVCSSGFAQPLDYVTGGLFSAVRQNIGPCSCGQVSWPKRKRAEISAESPPASLLPSPGALLVLPTCHPSRQDWENGKDHSHLGTGEHSPGPVVVDGLAHAEGKEEPATDEGPRTNFKNNLRKEIKSSCENF